MKTFAALKESAMMKTSTALKLYNPISKKISDKLGAHFKMVAACTLVISVLSMVIGCLTMAFNSIEIFLIPLCYILTAALFILFLAVRKNYGIRWTLGILSIISLISAVIISLLPEYMQVLNIHGIFHRPFISGMLMVIVALTGTCYSLYYWREVKPHAADISRYPLLLLPAALALMGFILIIYYVVANGAQGLSWSLITKPFLSQSLIIETWQDGWPTFSTQKVEQIGMLNNILGTLLLMLLTSLISLPIGVGIGVFITQYASPRMTGIIGFSTRALRSISGIILLLTAMSVLSMVSTDSPLYYLFHGYGYNMNGQLVIGSSSFILSSVFISLLVIPVIAQATQEGLNTLPREIYEGSLAIGASKEYTLFHVQLPWSFPNIVTGLLLGCAEAAGSLTIIFLIAGDGQYGVSPLSETTSLAYLIFVCRFGQGTGESALYNIMSSYQYTAAFVLLFITLGLITAALIMKKKLARRYKGE